MVNNQAHVQMEKLQLKLNPRLSSKSELRHAMMAKSQHAKIRQPQLFVRTVAKQLVLHQNVLMTSHQCAQIRPVQALVLMDHLLLLLLKLELKLLMQKVIKPLKQKKLPKVLLYVLMEPNQNALMALNQSLTKLQLPNLPHQHALMVRNLSLVLEELISQNKLRLRLLKEVPNNALMVTSQHALMEKLQELAQMVKLPLELQQLNVLTRNHHNA
jgi:hypothetical protein